MVTIRWDIKTIDRLSMVEDVLKEFSCCDINIISMKVTPGRILIKSTVPPATGYFLCAILFKPARRYY